MLLRIPSLICVICLPLSPEFHFRMEGMTNWNYITIFWNSMISFSIWPLITLSFVIGIWLCRKQYPPLEQTSSSSSSSSKPQTHHVFAPIPPTHGITLDLSQGEGAAIHNATKQAVVCIAGRIQRNWKVPLLESFAILLVLICFLIQQLQLQLQSLDPDWTFSPFLYVSSAISLLSSLSPTRLSPTLTSPSSFSVIDAKDKRIPEAIKAAMSCSNDNTLLENDKNNLRGKGDQKLQNALCLDNAQWHLLSAGVLRPYNAVDVVTVLNGLEYTRHHSGGLIVCISYMDYIPPPPSFSSNPNNVIENPELLLSFIQANVEALLPFVSNLSILFVIDSKHMDTHYHPSMKQLQQWEESAPSMGYTVTSVALNTQREVLTHLAQTTQYKTYSHVMMMDPVPSSITTSLSPIGILHSFGAKGALTVLASSSQTILKGSFGSVMVPYHYPSIHPKTTSINKQILESIQKYCFDYDLDCNGATPHPLHLAMVTALDQSSQQKPYAVQSVCHGDTIYPMSWIKTIHRKDNAAKLDPKDDPLSNTKNAARRLEYECEPFGFQRYFQTSFYINPKWRRNISSDSFFSPIPLNSNSIFTWATFSSMFLIIHTSMTVAFLSWRMIQGLMMARHQSKNHNIKKQ